MDCDYLIVGGGSAGCVLAARLSERPGVRVILVEAGRDMTDATMPADIRASYPGTAYIDPRNLWPGLTIGSVSKGGHNRPEQSVRRPYAQARILGGGSTINGQMANWGVPSDYDEWQALGADGWAWEDVFPYFRKVETDLDFPGPRHGTEGPIAVRRIPIDQWSQHQRAIARALSGMGYAALGDQNGDFGDGWFPLVHNNRDEQRVSAATAYLDEATRRRPNLRILTETQAVGLDFDGRRCVGARVSGPAGDTAIAAREVILSAGAIHSPAILLRAGIGPTDQLKALGIPVVAALPGVGRGLMDHPQIALGSFLRRSARLDGSTGRHVHMGLRYTSSLPDAPQGDMFMGAASRTAWHAVGRQLGALTVWVNKTFSRDGEVRLVSPDWRVEPDVDFRLLSDARDMERLKEGFHLMARVQMSEALQEVSEMPFPASYTDRARQVGAFSPRNRLLTGAMAALLEGPAALRHALMRRFVLSRHDMQDCLHSDEALEAFITEAAAGIWHASCSCRMGGSDDRMAVTDSTGAVRGLAGLRVCDASIFPSVPSANTNIPVMMTAEKIAAALAA
jgi:5-(hydroxymethyl)furfural/furfural oxidase